LAQTTARLNKTEADAVAAAKDAEAEISKRNEQIAELNTDKSALSSKIAALDESILKIQEELEATSGKLDLSERNRTFLVTELKRLQSEKAELERQLNSIDFLTEQVRRLKQETSMAGRLDIMRKSLYGFHKGGERMVFSNKRSLKSHSRTNYNMNVEIHQDGEVKTDADQATEEKKAE